MQSTCTCLDPGAGLKVEIALTSTQVPKSFLEIENLDQNIIMQLCTLNCSKLCGLSFFFCNKVARRMHLT